MLVVLLAIVKLFLLDAFTYTRSSAAMCIGGYALLVQASKETTKKEIISHIILGILLVQFGAAVRMISALIVIGFSAVYAFMTFILYRNKRIISVFGVCILLTIACYGANQLMLNDQEKKL